METVRLFHVGRCGHNRGPTRWGNQLNGNTNVSDRTEAITDERTIAGPTRWGNQLNGNILVLGLPLSLDTLLEAPLAGAIS